MPIDVIEIHRGESPWQGYTSSHDEEQSGMTARAVAFTGAFERIPRLDVFAPKDEASSAIDRDKRRVVVNERFLSDVQRADATGLGAGTKHTLVTVKDPRLTAAPKKLVTFFLMAQLIRTYAHVGATLQIVAEKDGPVYRAEIDGEHEYFTNRRNVERVHFAVEIDKKSGVCTVIGL